MVGNKKEIRTRFNTLALCGVWVLSLGVEVWGQVPPDAGRVLQETVRRAPEAPQRSGEGMDLGQPRDRKVGSGGMAVEVKKIVLEGNTKLRTEELEAQWGDYAGRKYDLAGLEEMAWKLESYYRRRGYPFVRVVIPEQRVEGGVVRMVINEGRYGKVEARGFRAGMGQDYLAALRSGEVIEQGRLERQMLLMRDLPGIAVDAQMKPGAQVGHGDLGVELRRDNLWDVEVGADNHGNRYTGRYRGKATVEINSPFLLGDQIRLYTVGTDENQWLVDVGYGFPLGGDGLRGNVGYTFSRYELGKEFEVLEASGEGHVVSGGLSYPIVRSMRGNLVAIGTYQHKEMEDRQEAVGTENEKWSDLGTLGLNFDVQDGLWAGGMTYGSVSWTHGYLNLDDALEAADRASGLDTRDHFDKFNLEVIRLQSTGLGNLTLWGRFLGQWALKNMDSSEGFSVGGPYSVRAYPVGEGTSDEGYLMQVEIRYPIGGLTPYGFYDAGWYWINADNEVAGPAEPNHRSLSGAGVGLRYQYKYVSTDFCAAWRIHGGPPQSDTRDKIPQFWWSASVNF